MTDQTREHVHEFVNVIRDGVVVDNACRCGMRPIDLFDEMRVATPNPAPSSETPEGERVDALARALREQSPWKDDDTFLDVWAKDAAAILAALSADGWRVERERLDERLRGDGPCKDCGTLDNIIWFTDNVFWNAVTGENVVHEESRGAILCAPCFVQRTAVAGFHPTGWRLLPEWPWSRYLARGGPDATD